MIVDNELNQWMVNPLPPGVRLHAIIDACHSGSAMDLEFRCALLLSRVISNHDLLSVYYCAFYGLERVLLTLMSFVREHRHGRRVASPTHVYF